MFQCVIFDMDGVIIDSEPLHYRVFEDHCKDLGFKASTAEYDSFIGSAEAEMFAYLREKYRLPETVESLVENKRLRFLEYLRGLDEKPIPGVEALVRALAARNIKLALASSSDMAIIDAVLDKFNMAQLFDVVVSGAALERSKPAPDIFLRAAALLGVSPDVCLVIEDSKNGVTAAKAAGMKCIGYYNPNSGGQDLSAADRIISRFSELDCDELIGGRYF